MSKSWLSCLTLSRLPVVVVWVVYVSVCMIHVRVVV